MIFAPVSPPGKKVSSFHTGMWHTMFRLTTNMMFDLLTQLRPFEIAAEMKTKCKIWLKC